MKKTVRNAAVTPGADQSTVSGLARSAETFGAREWILVPTNIEIHKAIINEERRIQDIMREERILTDMRYLPYGMVEQIRANHHALIKESEQSIKDLYNLEKKNKNAGGS